MAARIALSLLFIISLPGIMPAQTAPPEVEQAVRARVTEFLQFHVDGNFRKAYDMVAEETKDEYFTMGKVQLKGFTVDGVTFTDNFTKATVTGTISKTLTIVGQEMPLTIKSVTAWKIENSKWVWYNDAKASWPTPFGPGTAVGAADTPAAAGKDDVGLPKDLNEQAIAAAARSLLQQVGVDKQTVTLAADKPSEETVVFHNGTMSSVQLELGVPEIPGFTAKVGQVIARAAADVPIVFRYEPGDQPAPAGRSMDPFTVQLIVQPASQLFTIQVKFAPPIPQAPKTTPK